MGLTQQGAEVYGSISFHKCPGEGQVTYSVSGKATTSQTVELIGVKSGGSPGGIGVTAPTQMTFTIAKLGPPSPNLAD